jgi:hypothetical protein
MLPKPIPSLCRTLKSGKRVSFPTFPDFVRGLIESREIECGDDLLTEKADLLSELMFEWIRRGQTGCRYAEHLVRDRERNSWKSVVINYDSDLLDVLNPMLDAAHTELQALNVILPRVTTPEDVVSLVNQLCRSDRWYWERRPWRDEGDPARLLVGLRWRLPGGHGPAWVLGFAPFEAMPFTRRIVGAPFTALAIRPSCPPNEAAADGMHLCHMMELVEQDRREELWRQTEWWKQEVLSGEYPETAKAQVTFALPLELAETLTDETE